MIQRYRTAPLAATNEPYRFLDKDENGPLVLFSDYEQAMKEKESAIIEAEESIQILGEHIATLTEELRLSGLRGDSLDRVVTKSTEDFLTLTSELEKWKTCDMAKIIEALKAENRRLIENYPKSAIKLESENARQAEEIERLRKAMGEILFKLSQHRTWTGQEYEYTGSHYKIMAGFALDALKQAEPSVTKGLQFTLREGIVLNKQTEPGGRG